MTSVITWNMQGKKEGEFKTDLWVHVVRNVFLNNLGSDVVCLQECGRLPGEIESMRLFSPGDDTESTLVMDGPAIPITLSKWKTLFPTKRPRGVQISKRTAHYITHVLVGDGSGGVRTSLAIVTREEPTACQIRFPEDVAEFPGPSHRPMIGVLIEDIWFWSVHAIAKGGQDALGLLNCAWIYSSPKPWVVLGDFNRDLNEEKKELVAPGQWDLCKPDANTHHARHEDPQKKLDYAYRFGIQPVTGNVLTDITGSDHFPVQYKNLKVRASPQG